LQELDFPHCVSLHEQGLKGDALLGQYRKCFTMLELDHHPEVGITIIVTPNWMFIAPLTGPYTTYQGLPVYADGYAYLGLVNIQVVEEEWPATAGLVPRTQLLPMEVLEKSSRYRDADDQ
jgi:hypothetical protein